MGTTADGGKGSEGRAANGDRPVGAANCRREPYTMASCQTPPSARAAAGVVSAICGPMSYFAFCKYPPPPSVRTTADRVQHSYLTFLLQTANGLRVAAGGDLSPASGH